MHPIAHLKTNDLSRHLGFSKNFKQSADSLARPLTQWSMERDDAPILRYLLRNAAPSRHLEFGTWQGFGTLCCLEECSATVWTINLAEGESREDGSWVYSQQFPPGAKLPEASETVSFYIPETGDTQVWHRTDSMGFIGRLYREAGLGHRVCQIYCDTTKWDISNYPRHFFDTIFIDGGHAKDIVTSDTRKALELVRPGGLVIWHDYCPDPEVLAASAVSRGVFQAVDTMREELRQGLESLHWIDRSFMLLGVAR